VLVGHLLLKSFELDCDERGTRLTGEFMLEEKVQNINGVGNGPFLVLLACLHNSHNSIDAMLVIHEYSGVGKCSRSQNGGRHCELCQTCV
jgi:hypothetical protein